MLARFLSKPSNFRLLNLLCTKSQSQPPNPNFILPRFFSTNHSDNNDNNNNTNFPGSTFDSWKLPQEYDGNGHSIVGKEDDTLAGLVAGGDALGEDESWLKGSSGDAFEGIERSFKTRGDEAGQWETAKEFKPWTLKQGGEEDDPFDFGDVPQEDVSAMEGMADLEIDSSNELLEKEEQDLSAVLKGNSPTFF